MLKMSHGREGGDSVHTNKWHEMSAVPKGMHYIKHLGCVRLGNPDLDFENLNPDFPIERTLNDWSLGKQLILSPENLSVSRGGAEGNIWSWKFMKPHWHEKREENFEVNLLCYGYLTLSPFLYIFLINS